MFKDVATNWPALADWLKAGGTVRVQPIDPCMVTGEDGWRYRRHGSRWGRMQACDHMGVVWELAGQRCSLDEALSQLNSFLVGWNDEWSRRKRFSLSVKDLFTTGRFGPIAMDTSKEEVVTQLGPPTYYFDNDCTLSWRGARSWVYGLLEVYFDISVSSAHWKSPQAGSASSTPRHRHKRVAIPASASRDPPMIRLSTDSNGKTNTST